MKDRETTSIRRRAFLNRLLATTSLIATGAALRPAWSQSHGAHGGHVTRPRILGAAPPGAAATGITTPRQGPPLVNPARLVAGPDGTFALNAAMVEGNIGQTPVLLRAFTDPNNRARNLPLVGPTISIADNGQDQTVSIELTNTLPLETSSTSPGQVTQPALNEAPHGFNTINLHTHGLHVDPLEDNVFIELQPQANGQGAPCTPTRANPVWVCNGSFTYKYNFGRTPTGTTRIPAGTYWYHPHKHGSVGIQVASGMSGAFIVRGDLDELVGVKDLTEHTMVVQYIPFTPGPTPQSPSIVDPLNFYAINRNPPTADQTNQLMTINGQINPTIAMQYGQIQRWRFVNATAEQFFYLDIVPNAGAPAQGPQLYAIAVDGVPLTHSPTGISVPYLLGTPSAKPAGFADTVMNEIAILAPGQRLDLLVRAPASGVNATYSVNAMLWTAGGAPLGNLKNQTIATISLAGTKSTADVLPASALFSASAASPLIRPPLDQTLPFSSTQNIQFGFSNGGNGAGALFNIPPAIPPATSFAAPTPPTIAPTPFALPLPPPPPYGQLNLKLKDVDIWQVSSDPTFGFGPHSFHIHINSFMLLSRNGIDISAARIWRDTVRIDQQPGPSVANPNPSLPVVQFASQQMDYTGDFVMHCHVLQHEDAGMMWSVNIS
ncbi:MAG: multicopper oxidase family protein [Alphaproteobacteria bacterium]